MQSEEARVSDCRAAHVEQGLKDPEQKRKAIGAGFIHVFQQFADDFEKQHGTCPKYLVQVMPCSRGPAMHLCRKTCSSGKFLTERKVGERSLY
jgi:hypothetical protein